ncbi:MAG: hypothetical protein HGB34_03715 [Candidatus Moranbacteria bacterium]|nr:hypothetical protein [Candidatus Moranbacteria bacterium]
MMRHKEFDMEKTFLFSIADIVTGSKERRFFFGPFPFLPFCIYNGRAGCFFDGFRFEIIV